MRFKAWRGLSEEYRQAVQGHSPWQPDTPDPQPVCIPDIDHAPLDEPLREDVRHEGGGLPFFFQKRRGKSPATQQAVIIAPDMNRIISLSSDEIPNHPINQQHQTDQRGNQPPDRKRIRRAPPPATFGSPPVRSGFLRLDRSSKGTA